MNNDQQLSQLKNNFFSVDDDEMKHITNNLSTQSTDIKEDFLNFNFKLKKLTIGCPIRDIIAAIKIYPSNTLISNNK